MASGRTAQGGPLHFFSRTCAKRQVSPRVHEPVWNLKHTPPPAELSRGFGQSLLLWPSEPQLKQVSGLTLHVLDEWPT